MQGKAQEKSLKKRASLVQEYKTVFSTYAGRRVLYDLMNKHHMLTPSIYEPNMNITFVHEGERNVVLGILKIINENPQKLAKRIEEANQGEYDYV